MSTSESNPAAAPQCACPCTAALGRIGRVVFLTLLGFASLLSFPNAIPWMVAAWLLWYTLLLARGRRAWPALAAGLGILAVKGIYWTPAAITMGGLMAVVCLEWLVLRRIRGTARFAPLAWGGVTALWAVWALLAVDWYRPADGGRLKPLHPGRPVVCLGDSLTSFGYPASLRERLTIPVVDLGFDGLTTTAALKHLPALVAARPQVVVIELGGHDFLQGKTRAATKANLEKIIDCCRQCGAEVVLVEIPRGLVIDGFFGLERQLARRRGLTLIPDTAIRNLVFFGPCAPPGMWMRPQSRLSDDGLHPNRQGNLMLADYVARALAQRFGPGVLK
jgi:lysophospholipase L1-like esterase